MNFYDSWTKSLFPSIIDYLFIFTYLIVIIFWGTNIKNRKIDKNPVYSYYLKGLFAHLFGAIALGLIYTLYYKDGGDTTAYYRSAETLVNLLMDNPSAYFRVLTGDMSREALSYFHAGTSYPGYTHDASSFFVVRVSSIFALLGVKNYFTATILFAAFFYSGYWKLFLLFTKQYPKYHKSFAFAVLFFPSVLFWGSGISKDAITLSMTGWFLFSFFKVFIEKERVLMNLIWLLVSGWVIISVKPYVLVAMIFGVFTLTGWTRLKKVESNFVKVILAPGAVFVFMFVSFFVFQLLGPYLGDYGSLQDIIDKAILTYDDHTRAYAYGSNFYSLGTFDGTPRNFFSKAPQAIMAGLFRPFLWEARNPVMLIAGLENFVFLLIIITVVWRTGFGKTIKIILEEPLAIFCFSFAILFAFAVGIATANFGALVRLKIPLIPFLAVGLFIMFNRSVELRKLEENPQSRSFSAIK